MNDRTNNDLVEITMELEELRQELLEGLDRAAQLLRAAGCEGACARAEAYWLAHARMALTREHPYLGGSMVTMDDTIAELIEAENEPD